MTFCCWVLRLSAVNRCIWIAHQFDVQQLHLLLLAWLGLPWGSRWSLDALHEPKPPAKLVLWPASAGLLLQTAVMYVTAARAKTGPEWAQGTALQLVLQLGHLARPPAAWLLQQPWAQPVIRMGSLLARPIEGGMPLLFLVPCWLTRSSAVFVLMSMHLGVLLLVYLTDIPMINITVLIALLPGQFWDHLNARLPCQRHRALLLIKVQCTLERLTKTKQKVDVDIPKAPPDPVLARLSPILPPCGQLLVLLITFHLMGDQATMAFGPGWWTPTQTGRAVAKNLRLDAAWAVFAPGIQKVDWWITAPAQLGGSSISFRRIVEPSRRGALTERSGQSASPQTSGRTAGPSTGRTSFWAGRTAGKRSSASWFGRNTAGSSATRGTAGRAITRGSSTSQWCCT